MKSILVAAAILLTLPAAAFAGNVPPPEGTVLCGETGICMTIAAKDEVEALGTPYVTNAWVQKPTGEVTTDRTDCTSINTSTGPQVAGACTEIPCAFVTWQFTRFHEYRTSEWHLQGAARRCYPFRTDIPTLLAPGADFVESRPRFDTPDCNPTGDNERWFLTQPDANGVQSPTMKPGWGAPEEFIEACGGSEPPPVVEPPAVAKSCAAIALGKKRVAVTSRVAKCATGRNIMARWLRRGVEPEGWLCVTAKAGRARAATCAKLSRSKVGARITGRWRA